MKLNDVDVNMLMIVLYLSLPPNLLLVVIEGRRFQSITFDDNVDLGYSFPSSLNDDINTSFSFQFKTKQDNSFLLYVGSLPKIAEESKNAKTKFISFYLEDGLFHIIISNPQSVHPTYYIRKVHCNSYYKTCVDDMWHRVECNQYHNEILVIVDDQKIEFKNIQNEESNTTTHIRVAKATDPFYFYRKTHSPYSPPPRQFRGCMKEIYFIQNDVRLNIIELASKTLSNVHSDRKSYIDKCSDLFELKPITFSGKGDYISLAGVNPYADGKMSLSLKTFKPNCQIAYQSSELGGQRSVSYFLSLEIRKHHLHFAMSHNSQYFSKLFLSVNISNGLWHTFELNLKRRYVVMILDNVTYLMNVSYHIQSAFSINNLLYIGAINEFEILSIPHQVWSGRLSQFFSGCITELIINDEPIQLDLLIGSNSSIKVGCKTNDEIQSLDLCSNQPCNEGKCGTEWDQRKCDCISTNHTGDTCSKEAITAEFNGYQFIKITFPHPYKSEVENLNLRFKTQIPNGLILSTQDELSDAPDKLEIFLNNGTVHILLNFGRGNKKFRTHENCFDGKWHLLQLQRRKNNLKIWIDENVHEFNDFPKSKIPIMRIKYMLIGSSFRNTIDYQGSSHTLSSNIIQIGRINFVPEHYFKGHIMHFSYNGQNFLELAKTSLPLNIEITASLQKADIMKSFAINFYSTKSYLVVPKINIFGDFRLEFQMKTSRESGLVLFLQGKSNDYLILEMVNGLLHISYNWGSGYKRKISECGLLNDDKWHNVKIVRHLSKSHSFAFRVDGIPAGSRSDIPVNKGGLNFNTLGQLHLGGYLENKSIVTFDLERPRSSGGFQGCIASFYINNSIPSGSNIVYKNLLREATEIKYVEENCPDNRNNKKMYCNHNSCKSGGKCIQHRSKYSCDCSMTSFSGPRCEYVSSTVQFIKHPAYMAFKYPITKKHSITQIAFGFQTNSLEQTSLISISDPTRLTMLINIEIKIIHNYGFIQVEYNTKGGMRTFMENRLNVVDGLYHVVFLSRKGNSVVLKIDNLSDRIYVSNGLNYVPMFAEELVIHVGSRSINSSTSFQGFISGISINHILLLTMLKEKSQSIIHLINKSNIILIQNFIPRQSDSSSIFLRQSEEEVKTSDINIKNNRLVVAKQHCPGITEDEKLQCQLVKPKGLVKSNIAYRNNKNHFDNDENNKDNLNQRETISLPGTDSESLLKITTNGKKYLKMNSMDMHYSKDVININIWLITAFSCGGALMLIALSCLIYRCSTKDEGSYNVKEDRICVQSTVSSCTLHPKVMCKDNRSQTPLFNIPDKQKSKLKRNGETKEWYV